MRIRVWGDFLVAGWVEVEADDDDEAMNKSENPEHWLDKDDTQPHDGFRPEWTEIPGEEEDSCQTPTS